MKKSILIIFFALVSSFSYGQSEATSQTELHFDYSEMKTTYHLGESINICLLHRVRDYDNRYMALYVWVETLPSWLSTTPQLEPVFDLCLTGTPNNSADLGDHTIKGVINHYESQGSFEASDTLNWEITLTITEDP